ncbi:MAG: N-acetyl-gamma-glutamyl-phosphate reductase [Nitrospirota bacterium]|nr:N-acetyl-gamma-glutamyl-phosphate reductase [Nitrospirota bacterium]
MIKVAVVGASGYTGIELLRLLMQHPDVEIAAVTSEKAAGKPILTVFPSLVGILDLECEPLDPAAIAPRVDIVFLALPHKTAMDAAADFLKLGKKVIDLSADFRLKDAEVYRQWYGEEHTQSTLLGEAVYGLPELFRAEIPGARLVSNPGCYPTATALGLAPLVKNKLIDPETIVVDAKSGVSGAGRGLGLPYHYPEANEALMAYKVAAHRHTPEIEQTLGTLAGREVRITFTPHLVPMNRGILSTIYARLNDTLGVDAGRLSGLYQDFYKGEPFVKVLTEGQFPNVAHVRGSNYCQIGVGFDPRTGQVVVVSVIDNLVKGASGQAVQNMNLMAGLPETTGLLGAAVFP